MATEGVEVPWPAVEEALMVERARLMKGLAARLQGEGALVRTGLLRSVERGVAFCQSEAAAWVLVKPHSRSKQLFADLTGQGLQAVLAQSLRYVAVVGGCV